MRTHRKRLTYKQFINLFTLEEWIDVVELAESNATGSRILTALRERGGRFNIETPIIVTFLNAIQNQTSMTAAQITEIKRGLPFRQ